MDAKYDTQLEADQRAWVASVTGTKVDGDFMEALQDGVVLCKSVVIPWTSSMFPPISSCPPPRSAHA